MWPDVVNMLSPWQWGLLAVVPPAIIALYFLKLKRKPLEVPSTYLWHKSIEDLHVNSIWQKLRRNLLLLLQLLVLLLAALALLRPSWEGEQISGDRFIFLIDNSASMQATDQSPTRLEEAKRRAAELIDAMKSGDVGMVVSFSDSARVVQTFTADRKKLSRAVKTIRPTQQPTRLREALKVASGLANPGRTGEDIGDVQVANPLPAKLYILSDGKFPPVGNFSLGTLEPVYLSIGKKEAANVAITAFDVRESEATSELIEAFARIENFGPKPVEVSVEVSLDGRPVNSEQIRIAPGETEGVVMDLGAVRSGVLKMAIACDQDDLLLDNEAHVVMRPPRRGQVLLVTGGNEAFDYAKDTQLARQIVDVRTETPEFLETKAYKEQAAAGLFDLIIYDRCAPKKMPQANTFFIGRIPPEGEWSAEPKVDAPIIIDVSISHPLLRWVDLVGHVDVVSATPLLVPKAGRPLVEADQGPLMAVASRERFEDVVLGFVLFDEVTAEDGSQQQYFGTNWSIRPSFAMFMFNLFSYLGGSQGLSDTQTVSPGSTVSLGTAASGEVVEVRTPSARRIRPSQDHLGKLDFVDTAELGVYRVISDGKMRSQFAVNLFDDMESSLRPRGRLDIGWEEVQASSDQEVVRQEIWRWLLLAGLAVLLLEWYIYNRRVYL